MKMLSLDDNGQIVYIDKNSEEVEIKDLSVAISLDTYGATLHKYGEKEYVENFVHSYNEIFSDKEESQLVFFSLSDFLEKNEDKIYLVHYILNHTLSSKVQSLTIAVKEGDLLKAKEVFYSM